MWTAACGRHEPATTVGPNRLGTGQPTGSDRPIRAVRRLHSLWQQSDQTVPFRFSPRTVVFSQGEGQFEFLGAVLAVVLLGFGERY